MASRKTDSHKGCPCTLSKMEQSIEIIVRGVFLCKEQLLLVRKKGASYTFLPGGHIRFGEPAKSALTREIEEELGVRPEIVGYLGTVEHAWGEREDRQHELNLIFQIALEGIEPGEAPISKESHLQFLWQPLGKLKEVNFQPYPLLDLLPRWLKGVEKDWGSSMADSG